MGSIYLLYDPATLEARYVGKTVHRPERRLQGHIIDARRRTHSQSHNARWINSLIARGERPSIVVIEKDVPPDLLAEAERHWIAHFRAHGARLTNLTDGGEGVPGLRQSDEARAKKSAAQKGRPSPLKGRPRSPEAVAKTAAALRGKKHSEEARANMSAAQRRKAPPSDETRAKMSAARAGRKMTAEEKAQMSARQKGRPRPEFSREWKANMSAAAIGKPKPHVAEANRRRWAKYRAQRGSENVGPLHRF